MLIEVKCEMSNSLMDMTNFGKELGRDINRTESDNYAAYLYGNSKYGDFGDKFRENYMKSQMDFRRNRNGHR